MRGNLRAASNYLKVFTPFQKTFEENEDTLVDVNKAFADTPLDEMESAISGYKTQGQQFEDIPRASNIGCMWIDSVRLRMQLLPSPVRCLAAIKDLLPELIRS